MIDSLLVCIVIHLTFNFTGIKMAVTDDVGPCNTHIIKQHTRIYQYPSYTMVITNSVPSRALIDDKNYASSDQSSTATSILFVSNPSNASEKLK